jgi:proton-dependent oligopeptide transporter, POT family
MSTSAASDAQNLSAQHRADELFGHPKGLYVCFFTEMWERFSFYGMKALLFLYLTKHHLFTDRAGYDVIGAYGALVYCIPVIGGLLADRYLGMRKAVIFGGILLCLGHAGMAIEGAQAVRMDGAVMQDKSALFGLYLSLSFIIMGVGFLKPNISTIVGKLYPADDPRRDSGFSLFYAGINLGALFASIVCGYMGETLGWRFGFGAAGVGMVLGLVMFIWGQKYLHGLAEPKNPERLRDRIVGLPRESLIYAAALLGVVPVALLMASAASGFAAVPMFGASMALDTTLLSFVSIVVGAWFVWFITTQCSPIQRSQMLSLMVLILLCLLFFTLYEQTYGSWVAFTDRLMTKDLFPSLTHEKVTVSVIGLSVWQQVPLFFSYAPMSTYSLLLAPLAFVVAVILSERAISVAAGSRIAKTVVGVAGILLIGFLAYDLFTLKQTAGSLTFLGALFIVLLAPIFTVLWGWLDRYSLNPSKPVKSAFGLIFAGLSFVPLMLAANQAAAGGALASVWWLVLAYLILEIGEMCLSPVGLSAVTQLSVSSVVSLMMGTWFLATAWSEKLAAQLGKLAAIEVPDGATMNVLDAATKYHALFQFLLYVGLVAGVLALLAAPLIRRGMHGVK